MLTADSAQTTGTKWATPVTTTAATDPIYDAKGDLVVGTGADASARLAIGSNGQVLTADSTQPTGARWTTPTSPPGGDVSSDPIFDAKGDIAVGTGPDTSAKLPIGSDGQVLTADSAQTTGAKWSTPVTVASDAIFDAKGDLVVGTGADASSRLAVGSNGQVLTADSAQATGTKWATPATPSIATDPIYDAKGDLPVGTGADASAKVTVGANGTALVADSAQTAGVKWAAPAPATHASSHQNGGSDEIATATPLANVIPKAGSDGRLARGFIPTALVGSDAIFDAKGDLAVGTGADTSARLAVGVNGQVLTADNTQSTGVSWATPSTAVGTALPGQQYVIYKDAGAYKVLRRSAGTFVGTSYTDGGAALAAISSDAGLGTNTEVLVSSIGGLIPMTTVPDLFANRTAWLKVIGENRIGSGFQLSDTARSMFTVTQGTTGNTVYHNYGHFENLTIDANYTAMTTPGAFAVFGWGAVDGTRHKYVGWQHWRMKGLNFINGTPPNDPDNKTSMPIMNWWIGFSTQVDNPQEDTRILIEDIRIEDINGDDPRGPAMGHGLVHMVAGLGTDNVNGINGTNVWIDNWTIRHIRYVQGTITDSTSYGGNAFQITQRAVGGSKCIIEDVYTRGTGDISASISTSGGLVIRDYTFEDSNGLAIQWEQEAGEPGLHEVSIENLTSINKARTASQKVLHLAGDPDPDESQPSQHGTVRIRNLRYLEMNPTWKNTNHTVIHADAFFGTCYIDGLTLSFQNLDSTTGSNFTCFEVNTGISSAAPLNRVPRFYVKNMKLLVRGAKPSGGGLTFPLFSDKVSPRFFMGIDGVDVDFVNMGTPLLANRLRIFSHSIDSLGSQVSGYLRNVRFNQIVGVTKPCGDFWDSAATIDGRWDADIATWDWSKVSAGGGVTSDGTVPSAGDTVVVNGRTYTFQSTVTAADDILIPSTLGTSLKNALGALVNLRNAINNDIGRSTDELQTWTASGSGDTLQLSSNGRTNGQVLYISSAGASGLTVGNTYYVVNANSGAGTVQLSTTAGGSPIDIPSNGTVVTGVAGYGAGTTVNADVRAEVFPGNERATAVLTSDGTNVSDGDTVTVGSTVYTFKTSLTSTAYQVKIGATAADSLTNLFHAINSGPGQLSTYSKLTLQHPNVFAAPSTSTTLTIYAKTNGAAANSIATTETSSHLSWGASTMQNGGWSRARYKSLALVAKTPGVAGNSITLTESSSHLTVSGATLTGGDFYPVVFSGSVPNGLNGMYSATSAYTILPGIDKVYADATSAPFTVTLPDAVSNAGLVLKVKRTNSTANAVTVAAAGTDTIDGAGSYLPAANETLTVRSDGTGTWRVE